MLIEALHPQIQLISILAIHLPMYVYMHQGFPMIPQCPGMQHLVKGRFLHPLFNEIVWVKVLVIELVVTRPHTVAAWPLRIFRRRHLVGKPHGQYSSELLSEVRPPLFPILLATAFDLPGMWCSEQ
jgi:hypothetical protein